MTVTQTNIDAARASGTASVSTVDVNNLGGGSLQLMFAKLQLSLAGSSKNNATGYINDIQKTQEEQKKVAAMLQQARQLQADAKAGQGGKDRSGNAVSGASSNWTAIPADMENYIKANGLAYDDPGQDIWMDSQQWDVAITSLQARLDALGTDTQQKMVFVQDYMGQYNSYLQGANSVIQQSNQTL
ncbi:MAG: USH1C-binding protein 1, partial [Candidatus Accumulibacter sp.]|nr:USH1C-binding protein 1 [Accumulibacter sp.]